MSDSGCSPSHTIHSLYSDSLPALAPPLLENINRPFPLAIFFFFSPSPLLSFFFRLLLFLSSFLYIPVFLDTPVKKVLSINPPLQNV